MASNYVELFSRIWETACVEWRTNGPTRNFLQDFIRDLTHYGVIRVEDLVVTLILGVIFTLLRYVITENVLKPFAIYCQFIPKDVKKFPESAWKLLFYFSIYLFCFYTLFNGKHNFFEDPDSIWIDWVPGLPIDNDIYAIYVIEAGFYCHSIYATIFMDKWRQDTIVMILHHILANFLIIFSFAIRYHNIGLIVLFLHDINDIFLEATKICVCFKSVPGKLQTIAGYLVNIGFLVFAFSWFCCRLYQYPHRVLYSTGYAGRRILPTAPFYFFFNGMLWMLFAMNIWWFHFVLLLIWRVLNGQSREIEDTRELSKEKAVKVNQSTTNGVVTNGMINKIASISDTKPYKIMAEQLNKNNTMPNHRHKKNLQGTT